VVEVDQVMGLQPQDLVVVVAHKEMQVDQQVHLLKTTLVVAVVVLMQLELHQLILLMLMVEQVVLELQIQLQDLV
tara:strand:+ start:202 stop:426 length:225 start_codon:yes stop_codon:yes gene_type:complete